MRSVAVVAAHPARVVTVSSARICLAALEVTWSFPWKRPRAAARPVALARYNMMVRTTRLRCVPLPVTTDLGASTRTTTLRRARETVRARMTTVPVLRTVLLARRMRSGNGLRHREAVTRVGVAVSAVPRTGWAVAVDVATGTCWVVAPVV